MSLTSRARSGSLVVEATVADGAVGVDVERVSDAADLARVVERLFAPAERAAFAALPAAARPDWFTRVWTLKEAYAKATGDGLALPLDAVAFRIDGAEVSAEGLDQGPWHLRNLLIAPGIWLALAWRSARGGEPTLTIRRDEPGSRTRDPRGWSTPRS